MTAICGGGTSSGQAGYGATVALTVGAIGGLLNNIPTPWAVGAGAYLGLLSYTLSEFCTVDPPPVPSITAADYAALFTILDPIGHTQAIAKFKQLVDSFLWYRVCKCDSIATPAPPAAPPAPAGLPQINPPGVGPSGPPGDACVINPTRFTGLTTPPSGFAFDSITFIGRSPTLIKAHIVGTATVPPGIQTSFNFRWFRANSAGSFTFVSQDTFNVGPSGTFDTQFAPPIGIDRVDLSTNGISGTGQSNYNVDVSLFCGGDTPFGPAVPCPDNTVTQQMLAQILDLVTLIQRQAAPFAYVTKATHSALSGRGELAVQGLIGAIVTITSSITGTIGEELGDPLALWGAGWVNWGTLTDGFGPREFLSGVTTLFLPPSGGVYTRLGYSLPPGVVVTIRELAREP